MDTINITEFKAKILHQGIFKELAVYPYFSNEMKNHARILVVSDKVNDITEVTQRNKHVALVVPFRGSIGNSIDHHRKAITTKHSVAATVFSVYDFDGTKIMQID